MKKTNNKAKATPATPAPVPAKKAAKKTAAPKARPSLRIAVAAAKAVAVAVAPAAKKTEETRPPVVTTIIASIDIGFGNTLYVRGEGGGLNWETGVALDCVADDKWAISLSDAASPVIFKLLVNDLVWSAGENYTVPPGGELTVSPVFPSW
ncbi:MAG: hypothetical protein LBC18_00170 [Opitutaceae bacterium]|jgi:hypothetical protein|nr:hypothetical protein [Opitutaceae bacterium]